MTDKDVNKEALHRWAQKNGGFQEGGVRIRVRWVGREREFGNYVSAEAWDELMTGGNQVTNLKMRQPFVHSEHRILLYNCNCLLFNS